MSLFLSLGPRLACDPTHFPSRAINSLSPFTSNAPATSSIPIMKLGLPRGSISVLSRFLYRTPPVVPVSYSSSATLLNRDAAGSPHTPDEELGVFIDRGP